MSEFLAQAGEIIPAGATVIAREGYRSAARSPVLRGRVSCSRCRPDELPVASLSGFDAPYLVTRILHDYSGEPSIPNSSTYCASSTPVLESPDFDFTLWELK